jgi:alpha-amylase
VPHDFRPEIPQDPRVPLGVGELQPPFHEYFGPDLAPINGKPPGYVLEGLLAAAEWLTGALDVRAYRFDHVPGISTDFLRAFLDRPAMRGKFAVAEFFTGDLGRLRGWIADPNGMANRCSAFDFPLWGTLIQMCNHPDRFNMANLDHAGLAGVDPFHAVTFVENHDTESRPDIIPEHIIHNKALGYAYILTSEGLPCVFYKDYSTDRGCLGMKPVIDNLVWIHQNIADGPTQQRWKDPGVFTFERLGGSHLLVGLNKDANTARTIAVDTGFGAQVQLQDYSGHGPDVTTDQAGRVALTIPRNVNGLGYVCYSRSGIVDRFVQVPRATTQVYEGAHDLDIKPADDTQAVPVCRVWVAAGSAINVTLEVDRTAWTDSTSVLLTVQSPDGSELARLVITAADQPTLAVSAAQLGWHTFQIRSSNTPVSNAKPPYRLAITYTAPDRAVS